MHDYFFNLMSIHGTDVVSFFDQIREDGQWVVIPKDILHGLLGMNKQLITRITPEHAVVTILDAMKFMPSDIRDRYIDGEMDES